MQRWSNAQMFIFFGHHDNWSPFPISPLFHFSTYKCLICFSPSTVTSKCGRAQLHTTDSCDDPDDHLYTSTHTAPSHTTVTFTIYPCTLQREIKLHQDSSTIVNSLWYCCQSCSSRWLTSAWSHYCSPDFQKSNNVKFGV